ncbi:MAG: hypothetical protein ACKVS7_11405 [Gemmatimonadaceae bacterium]
MLTEVSDHSAATSFPHHSNEDSMYRLALIVGLAALPSAMAAQAASASSASGRTGPRPLPAPDVTFAEPFSALSPGTVRELRDGRLIVADARDQRIHLVDLDRSTSQALSNEGSGPREFVTPLRALGIGGDSTLIFDSGNSRYLLLDPAGRAITTWRPAVSRAEGGSMNFLVPARGADREGRLYVEAPPPPAGDGTFSTADTAPVIRIDRRTNRVDTLVWVRVLGLKSTTRDGQVTVVSGGGNPLTPRDEWAVFPDGRIAVARHSPYRIDVVWPDGRLQRGAPIPFTPKPITQADKDEEEERRRLMNRDRQNSSVRLPDGGLITHNRAIAQPPLSNFPATKPPFRAGLATVIARPTGELWVRRLEAAGSRGSLYDVIDASGAVSHQVRLEQGTGLVGFGASAIYTTRADEDGLMTLRRHRE